MEFNNGQQSPEQDLPIDEIFCDDDFNCRGGKITKFDVLELMKSIKDNGLLQGILVQPYDKIEGKKYRIVMGHRRFTACKFLGLKTIRGAIRYGLTETDAMRLNMLENIKRKDLNIIQEAKYLGKFRDIGLSLEAIAKIVGLSVSWVKDRVDLLKLPEDIQNEIAAGMINLTAAKLLCQQKCSEDELYAMFRRMKDAKRTGEKFLSTITKTTIPRLVQNPISHKMRTLSEIHAMQDMVTEALNPGTETRILGWITGHVTAYDLLLDIEELSKAYGINWKMPEEIRLKAENLIRLT